MKQILSFLFYCFFFTAPMQMFAQARPTTAKKTAPAKPKPKTTTTNKKIPAKTAPSVTVKTKVNDRKIVIKSKPAKLPEGVNKDEHATPVFSSKELDMISEINDLRRDPKSYIPYVQNYMKGHAGNTDMQVAGKELLKQLKSLPSLSQLIVNPVMYSAAKQFGLSLKEMDEIEHSNLPYYENLSLGHAGIRDAIVDLLIDDGEANRGHRKNLLHTGITKIAVYEVPGEVQGYRHCYVQVFK